MKNLMIRVLRRRKYVIRPKFQGLLMILSISYVIFFCAVIGTYLFIPLMMELDRSDIGSDQALVAAKRILYLNEKLWPALLFSFLAIACHSIYTSHKIAGPLYRFNFIFKAIKEGTVPSPIQVRKGDYLYQEMENINQMLEQLRDKMTELQEAQAELNRSIINAKDTVHPSSMDEFIKKMENLAEQGRKLEEKVGYFKVIS
jgi:methyl-accepting chemotaxis protein